MPALRNQVGWYSSPGRLRQIGGKVVGVGDGKAQTRFILGKIQRAVEAVGGTINDVVALNAFTPTCATTEISTKRGVKSRDRTSRPAPWSG